MAFNSWNNQLNLHIINLLRFVASAVRILMFKWQFCRIWIKIFSHLCKFTISIKDYSCTFSCISRLSFQNEKNRFFHLIHYLEYNWNIFYQSKSFSSISFCKIESQFLFKKYANYCWCSCYLRINWIHSNSLDNALSRTK